MSAEIVQLHHRGRPIQPSVRRVIAEYLAETDGTVRCGSDRHSAATTGTCPVCLLSVGDYLAVTPTHWPNP